MLQSFTLGASLPDPKPRPYEIEERHIFSPKEVDFDRIKNHPRIVFECFTEYQCAIDEVAWLHIVSGDPKYLRNFIFNRLETSGFKWPWMERVIKDFDANGERPSLWKLKGIGSKEPISTEALFRAWIAEIYVMIRAISDMRSYRSILDSNPDARFISRLTCEGASVMENTLCLQRNERIMKAIMDDDLDNYLSTYPSDHCTVDYFSKRQLEKLRGLNGV